MSVIWYLLFALRSVRRPGAASGSGLVQSRFLGLSLLLSLLLVYLEALPFWEDLRRKGGNAESVVPRKERREGGLACAGEGMIRSQITASEGGVVAALVWEG